MTADPKPVVVAVIGSGFIAEYHVEGLRAAGGVEIAAIAGRTREKVEAAARRFGIPRAETDIRRVLDDRRIDGVVIATPDHTHEALAIEALRARKEVLLQKPMAMTASGCRKVLSAAEASSAGVTVSFMHRYFEEVVWLRELLRSGDLGRVNSFRIRNATPGADWGAWFYDPAKVAGGVVMQLGVHGIDLCGHLFGPMSALSARTVTSRPDRELRDGTRVRSALEDDAIASYELDGGVIGSHEMSATEIAGCDRFRLEVYSERSTVLLRTERGRAAIYAPDVTGETGWVVPDLPSAALGERHHRHWLDIVRGSVPRDDTALAGLRSIEVAEAIYRSDERRCWLDLPHPASGDAPC